MSVTRAAALSALVACTQPPVEAPRHRVTVPVAVAPSDPAASAAPPPTSSCIEGQWCAEELPAGLENPIRGIWGSALDDVYAVGDDGVLHHDGRHWRHEEVSGLGPDEGLTAVWGTSAADVWATGPSGDIYRKKDRRWTRVWEGQDWLRAIWGSGPTDVYCVGGTPGSDKRGVIMHFDGSGWTRSEVGDAPLLSVSGLSRDRWLAVGWSSTLVVGGAAGWEVTKHVEHAELMAVWASHDVVYVGDWTDGVYRHGASGLERVHEGSGASAIWSDGSETYFVNWGRIGHHDGKTWSVLALSEADYQELYDVWGVGGHVFIVGTGPTVLHRWPASARD